jgi:hypothetical protein
LSGTAGIFAALGRATGALIAARHASGGWGWRAHDMPNTECTALAVMALRGMDLGSDGPDAVNGGVVWLRARQLADGGWPLNDQVPMSSWTSALAVIALGGEASDDEQALRGAAWLLGQESRDIPWLQRLWSRLFVRERVADQDQSLLGWPWTEGTTAWVEPTAWALLAVKRLMPHLPRARAAERIRQAELMLADRMCIGGGWNYGNRRVMGVELPPYADTTALALIALNDIPSAEVSGASVKRLRELTAGRNSRLVLALSILALRVHGEDIASLRAALLGRFGSTDLSGDIRTLALTLLALDEDRQHLKVTRHA